MRDPKLFVRMICFQNEEHKHLDDLIKNGTEEGMQVMTAVQRMPILVFSSQCIRVSCDFREVLSFIHSSVYDPQKKKKINISQ